jgi:penicillin-binding protein 2
MLIFDQLKKNEPQLRVLTLVVLTGLGLLLGGLWWVQIVSARDYQESLETQSFRTVRIPAVRGKILDRNGAVLAENRPVYNVSLYLEELRKQFDDAYSELAGGAQKDLKRRADEMEASLHRKLKKDERKKFRLSVEDKNRLAQQARYQVASNAVVQIGQVLREPLPIDLVLTNFERHYQTRLALPFPVKVNLTSAEIARLEEQPIGLPGFDLEFQSERVYPGTQPHRISSAVWGGTTVPAKAKRRSSPSGCPITAASSASRRFTMPNCAAPPAPNRSS